MIKDIFLIQVIVNVSVISHVILVNTLIIQIVSVKKKLIDPLIEKCIEYDDDNQTKIVNITVTKNDNQTNIVNKTVKNNCKVYIVLMIVAIAISTIYTIYFVYYNWLLIKNKDFFTKYNTRKETLIYSIQYINGVSKKN